MASKDLIYRFFGVDAGAGREFDRMAAKVDTGGMAWKKYALGAAAATATVAAYSVKMAMDFQKSTELIHTQAGRSQADVDQMRKGILAMAGAVGTSPEQLSEALFHIASTGLTASKSLAVLKVAAEGAKIGNADLTDVTNALNATIVSGIKGAGNFSKAMGALNAIVGAGDMHMQDLSDALGSGLLAVMKTFGVNLTQTGAALAVFGDNNVRGAQAATYLRQTVQNLSDPAAKADAAFKKIGLTTGQLQDALAAHGLTGALTMLHDHFASSGIAANKWGDVLEQAFTKKAGVGISILVEQFGRYQLKQAEVAQGAKNFGDDWSATTKNLSFQFDRLRADVEVLAIKFGDALLPIAMETIHAFIDIGNAVGKTVEFFQKNLDVTYALGGAIAGFLLPGLVKLGAAFTMGALETFWTNLMAAKTAVIGLAAGEAEARASTIALETSMGPVGIALAAIGAVAGFAFGRSKEGAEKAKQAVDDFVTSLHVNTDSLSSLQSAVIQLQQSQTSLLVQGATHGMSGFRAAAAEIQASRQQLIAQERTVTFNEGKIAAAYGLTRDQVEQLAASNNIDLQGSLKSVDQGFQDLISKANMSKSPLKDANANFEDMAKSTTDASQGVTDLGNSFDDLVGNFVSMKQSQIDFKNDLVQTVQALRKSHGSISDNTQASRDAATAFFGLVGKIKDVTDATYTSSKSYGAAKNAAQAMLAQLEQLNVKGPAIRKIIQGLKQDIAGMAGVTFTAGERTGKNYGKGLLLGLEHSLKPVGAAAYGLASQINKNAMQALGEHSPSKKAIQVGRWYAEGLAIGVNQKGNEVYLSGTQVAHELAVGLTQGFKGLSNTVENTFSQGLQQSLDNVSAAIQKHLAKVEARVKAANQKLTADLKARKQAIQGVASSVDTGADLSNLFGQDANGNPTVANISGFLSGQAGQVEQFAKDLKWAQQHHLAPVLLQEIAQLGAAQGDQVLKQFMTGQASITSANAAEATILRYANQAGATVVDTKREQQRIKQDRQNWHDLKHSLNQIERHLAHFRNNPQQTNQIHIALHELGFTDAEIRKIIARIRKVERESGGRVSILK